MVYSWKPRGEGEMTTMYLGRVLDRVGNLDDMPKRAREGHFDDYFCPPEVDDGMNMHRLIAELRYRSNRMDDAGKNRANEVIKAVMNGEFDGTIDESERWASSKEGQESFKRLLGDI